MSFFLPLKFSLTIVYLVFAPIRAPRPEHFFQPGALGGSTRGHYYLFVLLINHMREIPSYPIERVVRSFKLPYVTLFQNIPTDRTPPSPTVTSG